ncbi:hypothetical protein [Campylobacter sp. S4:11]|uniref:hypothetical protein n=1 Tax=Campylobacter sp. S4:11 TaxID=2735745 RepID=UPI00301C4254|nr:hypothetical protein [Campylobacter sp. S4:11]
MVSRIGDFNFVILDSFKANYFLSFIISKTIFLFFKKSNNAPWIYFSFYNFAQFLSLLAQLSEVDIKALIEYKDLLLKALSSLNESKTFDVKECTQLILTLLKKLF